MSRNPTLEDIIEAVRDLRDRAWLAADRLQQRIVDIFLPPFQIPAPPNPPRVSPVAAGSPS